MLSKRPNKFKLDAYRFYTDGHHPQIAFEMASDANGGIKLSGCMTNRSYSSSYMSDDNRGWIRRQIAVDNKEVIEYLGKWRLAPEEV